MTTSSSETNKDRNDGGGGATTTAILWTTTKNDYDAIFIACRDINKQQCCTDTWKILQPTLPSMNQDEFEEECSNRMAPATSIGGDDLHALFVSSNEGAKRLLKDDKSVKWKQYINQEWTRGNETLHPFAFDTHDASSIPNNMTFSTSLHSTLSPSGGMHRLLHHDLSISCPPNIPDGTLYQATLDMLVYVTHHFFVDMDDALDVLQSNTLPSLLSTKQRIDIEEPAFQSPHHVVGIQVQVEGSCTTNSSHTFATKLHTRYPPLTASGDLHVAFPAPFLLHATLVIQDESYVQSRDDFWWQAPVVTHVATGYSQDVMWVPMATILASVVGAFFILKSMAQVSKWN